MSLGQRNSGPGQFLRVILQEVDDSGPQQLVKVTGLAGQTIGEAVRSQPYGFSSNAPAGGEGLSGLIGGGMDRAWALGLEHPQYRPRNLPSGASVQYDNNGNLVRINSNNILISHKTAIWLQVGSSVSMTINSTGFHFSGGQVTHNGLDIGATHVHGGVATGPSNTGVPNP